MAEKEIAESWSLDLSFRWGKEAAGTSWRWCLGRLIRAAADKVDGRSSIAVHFSTTPALSPDTVNECLRLGVQHVARLAEDELRCQAQERLLQRANPKLYER